jgi:hypothetical protein
MKSGGEYDKEWYPACIASFVVVLKATVSYTFFCEKHTLLASWAT